MAVKRLDQRDPSDLRPLQITRGFLKFADGSCLIEVGNTRVVCAATIDEKVPLWMQEKGSGLVTAEYGMLPRATHQRTAREAVRGAQGGRTQEIQRLIGRALRAVVDLSALGEHTVQIDCDVMQADGGTRTAAITGAFVALHDALGWMLAKGMIAAMPVRDFVAAVSVGVYRGAPVIDLDYAEDSACETDMNVVMTGAARFVELQGTAEGEPFARAELEQLLELAGRGIAELVAHQRRALGS